MPHFSGWHESVYASHDLYPSQHSATRYIVGAALYSCPWIHLAAQIVSSPKVETTPRCDFMSHICQKWCLGTGFGLPPLEAMACGTPTISTISSSLSENLEGAAELIPPDNIGVLEDAIKRLLNDESLWNKRRAQRLERASQYPWEQTALHWQATRQPIAVIEAFKLACSLFGDHSNIAYSNEMPSIPNVSLRLSLPVPRSKGDTPPVFSMTNFMHRLVGISSLLKGRMK
ncbi:MAG: hypothetical protein DRR42_21615 [Gammaproteobacteria bacterium]|nr:MAG: hypothetical protein DRR42_21615 [Gammaproteobacteria bacterium]